MEQIYWKKGTGKEALAKNKETFDWNLRFKMIGFEEMFQDMIFKGGATANICDVEKLPDDLQYFSLDSYKIELVEKLDEEGAVHGTYYRTEEGQGISIAFDYFNRDSTILHEMIHLFEDVVNQLPWYWHDVLFWSLYSDLRNKIPNLDSLIHQHATLSRQYDFYEAGGNHDILFLLKSLDLDLQMGYELGTVLGYEWLTEE